MGTLVGGLKGCSIVILFVSDMRRLILRMMIYVVKKTYIIMPRINILISDINRITMEQPLNMP